MIHKKIIFTLAFIAFLFGSAAVDNSLHAAKPNKVKAELIQQVDSSSYDAFVSKDGVVVVQFYLVNCGPCIRMKKIFEEVAPEFVEQASFGLVLFSDDRTFARGKGINKVPTFILYRDGVEVKRMHSTDKASFRNWLASEIQ